MNAYRSTQYKYSKSRYAQAFFLRHFRRLNDTIRND